MPYKSKEDRTEAVRRYRERKKKEKEEIKAGERLQKKITQFLTEDLGFNTIPYRDFVEITQQDCVVEKDRVRSRRTGNLECEPEVFYGLNLLIVVDTVHIERKG